MWEYKIVKLIESDYLKVEKRINETNHQVNDEFKQKYPDWFVEKLRYSKEEQEVILEEVYYKPMRQRIRAIIPSITLEDPIHSFPLDRPFYFEGKLNEAANEGWELDKIRLMKPDSYADGILIFRRRVDEI